MSANPADEQSSSSRKRGIQSLESDNGIGAPAHNSTSMEVDDDEWEYEYDESKTETFYVTIDLSSNTGPARSRKRAPDQDQEDGEEAERDLDAGEAGTRDEGDKGEEGADDDDEQPEQTPPGSPVASQQGENEGDEATRTSTRHLPQDLGADRSTSGQKNHQNRIQILGLHTPNPVVSYDNQIFNCNWASAIGTDMLFSKPSPNPTYPVVRSNPGYDLVAVTSAKLIGTNAHLMPRKETRVNRKGELAAAKSRSGQLDTQPSPTNDGANQRPIIPVGPGASAARRNQARFLERLMKAKEVKGETDNVTVYSKRRLTQTGWRAQQTERRRQVEDVEILRHLAEEGDEHAQSRLEQLSRADPLELSYENTPSETSTTPHDRPPAPLFDNNLWRSALGTSWGDEILRTPRRGPGRPRARRGRGSGRGAGPHGNLTPNRPLLAPESSPPDQNNAATATPATWSEMGTPHHGTYSSDGAQM